MVVLRAGPEAPPPSPEAELEQLLAATTTKAPPPEVAVVVASPDPKLYRLTDIVVRLDGAPFAALPATDGGAAPKGVVVSEGDHVVTARLVYRGQALGPLPWEEGPKWMLPARVSIQANRGLRFTIRLTVEANERAPATQRLALHSEVEPEMLMPVDDAPLPPPPVAHLPPPRVATPIPVAVASTAPAVETPAVPKRKKKKAARAARPAAAAPAAAPAAAAVSSAPSGASNADALEEATARLRSALAAPRDGGPGAAGDAPH